MATKLNFYDYYRGKISSKIWQRGSAYSRHHIDKWDFDGSKNLVFAQIEGNYGEYNTEIQKTTNGFRHECDCPFDGRFCKHLAGLVQFLKSQNFEFAEPNTQTIVDVDFDELHRDKSIEEIIKLAHSQKIERIENNSKPVNNIFSQLQRGSDFVGSSPKSNQNISPQQAIINKIKGFITDKADEQQWYSTISTDVVAYNIDITPKKLMLKFWKVKASRTHQEVSYDTIIRNYNPYNNVGYTTKADYDLIKLVENDTNRYYGGGYLAPTLNHKQLYTFCSKLVDTGKLYFNSLPAIIINNAKLKITFDQNSLGYSPKVVVSSKQKTIKLDTKKYFIGEKNLKFVFDKPTNELFVLDNPESFEQWQDIIENIKQLNVGMSKEDVAEIALVQKVDETNNKVELPAEFIMQTVEAKTCSPQLYLSEKEGQLLVEIYFEYPQMNLNIAATDSEQKFVIEGIFDLEANRIAEIEVGILDANLENKTDGESNSKGKLQTLWIERNRRLEKLHIDKLQEIVTDFVASNLKVTGHDYFANEDAILFITEALEHIPQHWQIKGKEKLNANNFFKAIPNLRLSEVQDWLNIEGEIDFGGEVWSIAEIASLVRKNKRFIPLKNGGVGVMPKDWLEQHTELFELAEKIGSTLQVSKWHLSLLEDFAKTNTKATKTWTDQINKTKTWQDIAKLPKPKVQAQLRDYQQAGYEWLNFLSDNQVGGILADDMGLGKTLQTIAFLNKLYLSQPKKVPRKSKLAPTLLVLPKTLIFNWQNELAKFAPDLTYTVFYGNSRDKEMLKKIDTHLAITTYGTMLKDVHDLKLINWRGLILDESQQIKNPESLSFKALRLINAQFKLALSGTPVENNLEDLWSQMTIVNPGMLGSREFFRSKFALPIQKNKDEGKANKLRNLINPFILRRMKQQVAKELGDKVETTLTVEMTDKQKKLYDKVRFLFKTQIEGEYENNNSQAKFKVLEGLTKLRQICCHPRLLDKDSKADSAKLELMIETLQDVVKEGHKVLVFSQFTSMLDIVKEKLADLAIPYSYLDGKTNKREQVVQEFTDNPNIPVFLISLKAGGVGINLTCADYVFIYDPWWNPAVESQAVDRTHRIGQDKTVFVYRFVTKDSVEEKIMELQETKKELVKNIISVDESLLKKLNLQDIQKLFS